MSLPCRLPACCRSLVAVQISATTREVLEEMLRQRRTVILLRDSHGRPGGWLRLRDLVLAGLREGPAFLERPAGELPRHGVVAVPGTASFGECARVFRETGHRQLLVVGPGAEELGVLHLEDLLAATARSVGLASPSLEAAFASVSGGAAGEGGP